MENNLEKLLEFFHLTGRLKTTYRFKASEKCIGDSSADHSWRLSLMAFVLAEELKLDVDLLKSVKIALVHDLAEALAGDVDARLIKKDKGLKKEKKKRELKAMEKFRGILPEGSGEAIFALWEEYNLGKTEEAKFIKALDKIETNMHTIEMMGPSFNDLELIAVYGKKEVENFLPLKDFFALNKKEIRKELERQGFSWKEEYDIKD